MFRVQAPFTITFFCYIEDLNCDVIHYVIPCIDVVCKQNFLWVNGEVYHISSHWLSVCDIPPGGVVGNMLASHAVNPGSILGRGDT